MSLPTMPQGVNANTAWMLLHYTGVNLASLDQEVHAAQDGNGLWHKPGCSAIPDVAGGMHPLGQVSSWAHLCLRLGNFPATAAAQELAWITGSLIQANDALCNDQPFKALALLKTCEDRYEVLDRPGVKAAFAPEVLECLLARVEDARKLADELSGSESYQQALNLRATLGALVHTCMGQEDQLLVTANMVEDRRSAAQQLLADVAAMVETDVEDALNEVEARIEEGLLRSAHLDIGYADVSSISNFLGTRPLREGSSLAESVTLTWQDKATEVIKARIAGARPKARRALDRTDLVVVRMEGFRGGLPRGLGDIREMVISCAARGTTRLVVVPAAQAGVLLAGYRLADPLGELEDGAEVARVEGVDMEMLRLADELLSDDPESALHTVRGAVEAARGILGR